MTRYSFISHCFYRLQESLLLKVVAMAMWYKAGYTNDSTWYYVMCMIYY